MGYTRRDIPMLFDKVSDIPIESVIGERIELFREGMHYKGLCPFHNDKHLGSFVVTPTRKIWKCFTCGGEIGGDAVQFVSLLDGIDRVQAMLRIALSKGLVSADEYDSLAKPSEKKWAPERRQEATPKFTPIVKNDVDAALLDKVYSAFIRSCKLSDKDEEYLKGRKVDDAFMKDFFSFPRYTQEFMTRFEENLKERELSMDHLKKVPGFYKNKGEWDYMRRQGVAFAIRDEKGQIVGIQIRSSQKTGSRYIWFSSSFAIGKEDCEYGCGPGSPMDVVRPETRKNHVICITEGKFKAVSLAQLGLTTLSMQGVTNWKSAVNLVDHIIQSEKWFQKSKKTTVWICYDADARINEPVYQSMKNMQTELKRLGYKQLICYWPLSAGKGIDDVINAGHMKKIQKGDAIPFYRSKKLSNKRFTAVTKML